MKSLVHIFISLLFIQPLQAQPGSVKYLPGSSVKITQLVGDYDRQQQAATPNLTETRYGLASTDLGVPFYHNGRTYVLFGDSFGAPGGDAIAYTTDTNPDDGIDLDFITDSNGIYKPVTIPGISLGGFEVPMEGVSVDGNMYVYATTDHSATVTMGRSVVAVSRDNGLTFKYLYDLSTKHFINVSIVEVDLSEGIPRSEGAALIMFGSGAYRQSDVRLAYQPADEIDTPESLRYFTGLDRSGNPVWSRNEDDATPLFSQPCVGELSVSYNAFLQKWIMLYNCDPPRGINFRTADEPWGPWSAPQVLFEPWLDGGYCNFMHVDWQFRQCDSVHDPGRENEWGGEYGPFQFEELAVGTDTSTTIYFTLSTWNPYTVVLMKSTLIKEGFPTSVAASKLRLQTQFQLPQNHPNPFNPATNIRFTLMQHGQVTLQVFDIQGREVATLIDGELAPGEHTVPFDGSRLASGVYVYRLATGHQVLHKKMILIK